NSALPLGAHRDRSGPVRGHDGGERVRAGAHLLHREESPGRRPPGVSTGSLLSNPARLTCRKATSAVMLGLTALAAAAAVGALLLVLVYLLVQGFHFLSLRMLTHG